RPADSCSRSTSRQRKYRIGRWMAGGLPATRRPAARGQGIDTPPRQTAAGAALSHYRGNDYLDHHAPGGGTGREPPLATPAPPMAAALVAGAEAAVLSWLVVVVPAIATYVATASSPELGSAHWVGAARVGTVAWLLAHGAAPSVAQATISVVPLGLTLVAFALLVGSVRRA